MSKGNRVVTYGVKMAQNAQNTQPLESLQPSQGTFQDITSYFRHIRKGGRHALVIFAIRLPPPSYSLGRPPKGQTSRRCEGRF